MKIYCSRQRHIPFSTFVGKDVWVKCNELRISEFSGEVYAEYPLWINARTLSGKYINCKVYEEYNLESFSYDEIKDLYRSTKVYKLRTPDTLISTSSGRPSNILIEIAHPITVLSTEELFEEISAGRV